MQILSKKVSEKIDRLFKENGIHESRTLRLTPFLSDRSSYLSFTSLDYKL